MHRVARGVSWTLGGTVVWRLFSAISTIIVARILGPSDFGALGIIRNTVQLFAVYAGFRLGTTATRYVARYRREDPNKAARVLALSLRVSLMLCVLASAVLFLVAPGLAAKGLQRADLGGPLAAGALLLLVMLYANVVQNALAGFESFRRIAWIDAVKGVVTPVLCIPLAYFYGLQGVIWALIAVFTIAMVHSLVFMRAEQRAAHFPSRISFSELKSESPVLWQFALPGLLVGLTYTGVLWLGRLLLVREPSGYVEAGIFEAANQWRVMIVFLPAALARVALPILSESHGSQSTGAFRDAVSLNIRVVGMIALPLTIAVMGLAGPLSALFGKGFEGAKAVIPALMFAVYLHALSQALQQVLTAADRRWQSFGIIAASSACFVGACLWSVPQWGALGLAVGLCVLEGVCVFLLLVYVQRAVAPSALSREIPFVVFSVSLCSVAWLAQSFLPSFWAACVAVSAIAIALWRVALEVRRTRQQGKTISR